MSLRDLVKRMAYPVLSRAAKWYFSKERTYRFEGLWVKVPPGVFHPGYFLSTKLFIVFLKTLDLRGKRILELGCGSGLISLFAAKSGGKVTASDINPDAVKALKASAEKQQIPITCIQSDLFDEMPNQIFDLILINPPYYPKDPEDMSQAAFYCGSGFEYFHRLFSRLDLQLSHSGKALMILSQDCEIDTIRKIGAESGMEFTEVFRKRKMAEWNYIFEVEPVGKGLIA